MKKKHKHKWKYQINVKKKVIVLVILGVSLFVGLGYALILSDLSLGGIIEFGKVDNSLEGAIKRQSVTGCIKKYTGAHQDSMDQSKSTENIYYYDCDDADDMNNVVFANSCWKIIRTTDTGGVKLIYNGEPDITYNNGEESYDCSNVLNKYHPAGVISTLNLNGTYLYASDYKVNSSSLELIDPQSITVNSNNAATQIEYISKNYPYTCKNTTGICYANGIYKIDSQYSGTTAYDYMVIKGNDLGVSNYNNSSTSPAYVGYMYGDTYGRTTFRTYSKQSLGPNTVTIWTNYFTIGTSYYYADSIEWNNTEKKYYLVNPTRVTEETDLTTMPGKYVLSGNTSGSTVYYINSCSESGWAAYRSLSGGTTNVSIRYGDDIVANGDGTYSLTNPSQPIEYEAWKREYQGFIGKYTCDSSATTCANPAYISDATASQYSVMRGRITIAKKRDGLNLQEYENIDLGRWYQGYDTTYNDYVYTCGNTDTVCTNDNLRYITKRFPGSYYYNINYNMGHNVRYENGKYILVDVVGLEKVFYIDEVSTHHYICLDKGKTECDSVAYVYYSKTVGGGEQFSYNGQYAQYYYYMKLDNSNLKNIDDVLSAMHKKNENESVMKKNIDIWYEKKFKDTLFESYLDDTIYCNDRTIIPSSGWNLNGNITTDTDFTGGKYNSISSINDPADLSCVNDTDMFSVSNSKAKLKYKIALPTAEEAKLISKDTVNSNRAYSTMTPAWYVYFNNVEASIIAFTTRKNGHFSIKAVNKTGNTSLGSAVRPSVSLIKGTKFYSGDGSKSNPYVIDSPVKLNKWKNTQLSSTTVTANSATTTINMVGSTTNGNDLSTLEYYTTCSSGTSTGSLNNPQTSNISADGKTTITFNACPGAVLHYRAKDTAGNYSDDWMHVEDIGQYVLYAQVYNKMIYAGSIASNNGENLTNWVNNNNYSNTAHRLISIAYYDEDSETTVEALDTATVVERAYPSFLGRDSDSTKDTWISKLNNGEETIESFFLEFINSSEAKNIRSAWGIDDSEYHP